MPRARLDHKPRKALGFAVPDGVSAKDAWADARILKDDSTEPLPTAPSEAKPKRARVELGPCRCRCGCGSRGLDGLCWMCGKDLHHKCSRACAVYYQDGQVRGSQHIPPRAACNGGKGWAKEVF